jgi:hypothetical protein
MSNFIADHLSDFPLPILRKEAVYSLPTIKTQSQVREEEGKKILPPKITFLYKKSIAPLSSPTRSCV